jgi:heme/copper-type cytochrome/quinol oxidase subunit 4
MTSMPNSPNISVKNKNNTPNKISPFDTVVITVVSFFLFSAIPWALAISWRNEWQIVSIVYLGCALILTLIALTMFYLQTTSSAIGWTLAWLLFSIAGYFLIAPALASLSGIPISAAQVIPVMLPLAMGSNLLTISIERLILKGHQIEIGRNREKLLLVLGALFVVVGVTSFIYIPLYVDNSSEFFCKLFLYIFMMTGLKLMIFVGSNRVEELSF